MNKIAMLMPYFGKFPEWIDLYLYSCSRNAFVDFIFYTDCETPERTYPNTIFRKITFEDYCKKISKALDVHFFPKHPYKLVDARPFFAIIHRDELDGYDFWGYGDMDVVYGDLSIVLSEKKLKKCDIITTHCDRLAGHFTVIRKESRYSSVCYNINNWKQRLQYEHGDGLDEHDFTSLVYPQFSTIWSLYRRLAKPLNIHPYTFFKLPNFFFRIFSSIHIKEYYTSVIPNRDDKWIYDIRKNILMDSSNRELPYLHYLFFKKTPFHITEEYWKPGFWQVGEIDFNNAKGIIVFDNSKVIYKETD